MSSLGKFWLGVSLLVGLYTLGVWGQTPAATPSLKALPVAQLEQWQQQGCLWIHPWASWCTECVQELPALLPLLAQWKRGRVVVVDVGSKLAQEQFTLKWKVVQNSPAPVFLKPASVDLAAYQQAISPGWQGALPFNVLYARGKRLGHWTGRTDVDKIKKTAEAHCR